MSYTNTAASIWELVQAIAATSKKKEKEALVAQGMQLPLFVRIVKACYDPLTTYGFRELPELKPREFNWGGLDTPNDAWTIIGALAAREITGDAARELVQDWMSNMPEADMQLFTRIILKDMRAGFTEGTVNRVAPGTILEFPYMRCSLPPKSNIDKWNWADGVASQEKADGMFLNVNVGIDGTCSLHTRQGQPLPRGPFEDLHQVIEGTLAHGTQSHGEALVYSGYKPLPREENNGVLNHLINGGELEPGQEVRIFLWDQIPLASLRTGKCDTPYRQRLTSLASQVKAAKYRLVQLISTRVVKSRAEAQQHFREMLAQGKEGTVVKSLNAIWQDGTSKDQVKFKLTVDVDLKIVAINQGKPHTKLEGRAAAVHCVTECGSLAVDVTIKNEAMRAQIEADPGAFVGKIQKVSFNTIMKADEEGEKHSLFLPRMTEACVRLDKSVADTYTQVCDQYEAAIAAA